MACRDQASGSTLRSPDELTSPKGPAAGKRGAQVGLQRTVVAQSGGVQPLLRAGLDAQGIQHRDGQLRLPDASMRSTHLLALYIQACR